MPKFAVIAGGIVQNTVLADTAPAGAIDLTGRDPPPGPGWGYDALTDTFTQPAGDGSPRHVTRLAFRNRFTQPELIALEIAAIDLPSGTAAQRQQAAGLRVMLASLQAASFIDLARADTRAGVQQLEAAGLLGAGRALQILDAPIVDIERPQP